VKGGCREATGGLPQSLRSFAMTSSGGDFQQHFRIPEAQGDTFWYHLITCDRVPLFYCFYLIIPNDDEKYRIRIQGIGAYRRLGAEGVGT
ncbi:MAG: hypothetical protein RBT34_13730, partial [Anaerolineaceae bacterium]|nr:hypothetical protein [Anaerolineaceae bacterium]